MAYNISLSPTGTPLCCASAVACGEKLPSILSLTIGGNSLSLTYDATYDLWYGQTSSTNMILTSISDTGNGCECNISSNSQTVGLIFHCGVGGGDVGLFEVFGYSPFGGGSPCDDNYYTGLNGTSYATWTAKQPTLLNGCGGNAITGTLGILTTSMTIVCDPLLISGTMPENISLTGFPPITGAFTITA